MLIVYDIMLRECDFLNCSYDLILSLLLSIFPSCICCLHPHAWQSRTGNEKAGEDEFCQYCASHNARQQQETLRTVYQRF